MISPDAGNLGVKAVFVWAGLLLPTTILLWLFYPEVSDAVLLLGQQLTNSIRPTLVPTGSLMSFMRVTFLPGGSRTHQL